MFLSPMMVFLLIKDQHALHQWKLEKKYQGMKKWQIFQHEVFKAVTLKSALTTPTENNKFKALDNGL